MNKRENEYVQIATSTVLLLFRAQLKREKRRSPKSGRPSTLDMHSNYCIPGTRQLYGEHCDDYTFDSGMRLQSVCPNSYDMLEHQTKLCDKYVVSSTHAEFVECGQGQALAA